MGVVQSQEELGQRVKQARLARTLEVVPGLVEVEVAVPLLRPTGW